jgi:hypothetical protein
MPAPHLFASDLPEMYGVDPQLVGIPGEGGAIVRHASLVEDACEVVRCDLFRCHEVSRFATYQGPMSFVMIVRAPC